MCTVSMTSTTTMTPMMMSPPSTDTTVVKVKYNSSDVTGVEDPAGVGVVNGSRSSTELIKYPNIEQLFPNNAPHDFKGYIYVHNTVKLMSSLCDQMCLWAPISLQEKLSQPHTHTHTRMRTHTHTHTHQLTTVANSLTYVEGR